MGSVCKREREDVCEIGKRERERVRVCKRERECVFMCE